MIIEGYSLQNCYVCQHNDAVFSYIPEDGILLTCVYCFNFFGPYETKEQCVHEWNVAYKTAHGNLLLE